MLTDGTLFYQTLGATRLELILPAAMHFTAFFVDKARAHHYHRRMLPMYPSQT